MKRALTIAGSDSGGGAGVQADLKTFLANGVYGMSVITALTAQNTVSVRDIHTVPPTFVRSQFEAVAEDIGFDAVKIGMLAEADIVKEVVALLKAHPVGVLVVDPVMVATSGGSLLRSEAAETLKNELLPMATVITPNMPEASALLGREVQSYEDMKLAAADLYRLGPKAVLIKGGHMEGQDAAVDILYDGDSFQAFSKPWISTRSTHGTGCTLASAITAWLARGLSTHDAVHRAKDYVFDAIRHAHALGRGHGPLNHGYVLGGE